MKRILLVSLFFTVFSLPVFAQVKSDESNDVTVKMTREFLEYVYKNDDAMTVEERKEILDKIFQDGIMTEEERKEFSDEVGERQTAQAIENGCVTRDVASVFAKEQLREIRKQYEVVKDFYDAERALGVSGYAPSLFSVKQQQWWFFLWSNELGFELFVFVSCDGSEMRTWSSNR